MEAEFVQWDQCPGYWRRSDETRWGKLPHMIDVRSAYEVAIEGRYGLEHGAIGRMSELPAKLKDAISVVMGIEAAKLKKEAEEARKGSDGKRRLKLV